MEGQLDTHQLKFLKRKGSVELPSYFNEATLELENLKEILGTPPDSRTEAQINALMAFSKNVKFFGELRNTINESAHAQCCRHLTYSCFPGGTVTFTQYVFHEGDAASRFYIILSGSCAVISSVVKAGSKPGAKAKSQLLTILRQGDCFGEIALISNKHRLASLLTREECHFAVLEREDYRQILWKIQNKQLHEKVQLLMLHPVIATWKKENVQRLSYYFKSRSIRHSQTLFTAGQSVNEVFLIKEGAFQLTKTVIYYVGKWKKKQKRKQVHFATVGPGEILGAAQALEGNAFEYTCTCSSENAEALLITKQHFRMFLASEGKLKELIKVEREREQEREDSANMGPQVKESRSEIPAIDEEFYRHLTEKSPIAGNRPIIYHPKRVWEEMHPVPIDKNSTFLVHWREGLLPQDTSLPEIETKALRVQANEGQLNASHTEERPAKQRNSIFKQQKWRDFIFNPKKPRLITDGVELYRHFSLPRLETKADATHISE